MLIFSSQYLADPGKARACGGGGGDHFCVSCSGGCDGIGHGSVVMNVGVEVAKMVVIAGVKVQLRMQVKVTIW